MPNSLQIKKLFLLISLIFISYTKCYCQNTSSNDSITLDKTVVEPEFNSEGGGWNNFLKKHINYDIAIFNDAPRGIYIVKIKFTVFEDGHLGDFVALTRFGYGMEKEVIKALKKSPDWKPAIQNGKPVKSTRIQTVRFAVEVL